MSHPSASPGQIKIKHGLRRDDLFICNGEGASKSDALLLLGAVMNRVLEADFMTHFDLEVDGHMADGILAQLEARGYDPKTLEISIRKTR
ncbi:hypothetical protein [Pseudosulfitobacter pseudonitzschiae]|uniref:hypothetical protein n=1 Tax=Pseudosulfitobacter pseudonitzschiae TaxID=1402135 RepID=UPI003B7A13F5